MSDVVIADLYRLADALLLTSREEGFGIPLLEAGISRLPIFCTEIPPLRAIAQDDAFYFQPETSAEVIAQAIQERLERDPLYRVRCRVRLNFSWEVVYQRQIAPLLEAYANPKTFHSLSAHCHSRNRPYSAPKCLNLARELGGEITLYPLSSSPHGERVHSPRQKRKELSKWQESIGPNVRIQVLPESAGWPSLRQYLESDLPDLLLLEIPYHFQGAFTLHEVLSSTPCNLA